MCYRGTVSLGANRLLHRLSIDGCQRNRWVVSMTCIMLAHCRQPCGHMISLWAAGPSNSQVTYCMPKTSLASQRPSTAATFSYPRLRW